MDRPIVELSHASPLHFQQALCADVVLIGCTRFHRLETPVRDSPLIVLEKDSHGSLLLSTRRITRRYEVATG
jgi:hypothetical protein